MKFTAAAGLGWAEYSWKKYNIVERPNTKTTATTMRATQLCERQAGCQCHTVVAAAALAASLHRRLKQLCGTGGALRLADIASTIQQTTSAALRLPVNLTQQPC